MLPESLRQVIEVCYLQDKSRKKITQKELAGMLGVSDRTIRSYRIQAEGLIKEYLADRVAPWQDWRLIVFLYLDQRVYYLGQFR